MFSILFRMFGGGIIKSLLAGPFGKFLKLNWKYILVAAIVGFFVWKWYDMKNTIVELEAEKVTWVSENERFAANELQYQTDIAEQNDSILMLKSKSDEAKGKLDQAIQTASKAQSAHAESLRKLAAKVPENKSCEASIDFLVDRVGDLKW